MTNRVLIIFLVLLSLVINAFSQDDLTDVLKKDIKRDTKTYIIRSLDGKDRQIHIIPDYPNHVLRIICLKDTISINDYWGVPAEVQFMNKNFLSIKYQVRGGSGLGLGNLLILCVKKNTIYETIHVLRYSYLEDTGMIKDYRVKPVLIGHSTHTYKLDVNVHNKSYSKYVPSDNYDRNIGSTLYFDVTQNVFYSLKKDMYKTFIFYDIKTDKEHKQEIRGNFPEIILGNETYYYIKNVWCSIGNNNQLFPFSSRSGN